MKTVVFFYKKHDCYFKVNNDLKRITKIENNQVSYLDYDTYAEEIKSHTKIQMNQWKHIENSFFISRNFEWEYNGFKYHTTDKPITWKQNKHYRQSASVFHNGTIWEAHYSSNYYPRVYLTKKIYVTPTREVLVEKDMSETEEFINKENFDLSTSKWTDIKYCRNFEKIS